jgi:hypothetical protein
MMELIELSLMELKLVLRSMKSKQQMGKIRLINKMMFLMMKPMIMVLPLVMTMMMEQLLLVEPKRMMKLVHM